jgi:hypothetical protein
MAVVGGNTGEPNTFTGVNIADLTGGVFNAETLFEGNNLMCFAFQAVSALNEAVLGPLGCPDLEKYDKALFEKFPGGADGI